MGATEVERQLHDRITNAFVNVDPINVVLSRADRQPSGAGGWVDGPRYNISPQELRLVTMDATGGAQRERITTAGLAVRIAFALVGPRTADIKEGDRFTYKSVNYRVAFVQPFDRWRILAEVTRDG